MLSYCNSTVRTVFPTVIQGTTPAFLVAQLCSSIVVALQHVSDLSPLVRIALLRCWISFAGLPQGIQQSSASSGAMWGLVFQLACWDCYYMNAADGAQHPGPAAECVACNRCGRDVRENITTFPLLTDLQVQHADVCSCQHIHQFPDLAILVHDAFGLYGQVEIAVAGREVQQSIY